MNKTFKLLPYFFALTFTLIFASCTTRYKKANNLIEEKNYEEALAILDVLVAEDPKDSDYKVAQKRAREGVIDKSLIRVRMTRLANNQNESLEILRQTLEQQDRWQLFPTGAVAFTQNEELSEAFNYLKFQISQLDQKKKPIRILYLITRYKILFNEGAKNKFSAAYNEAEKDTRTICLTLSKQANSRLYFYDDFTAKLCKLVNQRVNLPRSESPLYNSIKITQAVKFNASQLNQILESELNKKLKTSGWLLSTSNDVAEIPAQNDFFFNERHYQESRTSNYTENRRETHYESQSVVNPSTGMLESKTVPVEKDIPESKFYTYYVDITEQQCRAQINLLKNPLSPQGFTRSFNEDARSEDNDTYLPNYNVSPFHYGNRYTQEQWINRVINASMTNLVSQFQSEFDRQYCSTLNEQMKQNEYLNQALMCARQTVLNEKPKAVPSAIETAFENQFYVNYSEMNFLLNLREN